MSVLSDVLEGIAREYSGEIWSKSNIYCIVDLGNSFRTQGIFDDAEKYDNVKIVVPLKRTQQTGINVEINGKDLSDFCQLRSGIAVPEWVAIESGLERYPYQPKEKMILTGLEI